MLDYKCKVQADAFVMAKLALHENRNVKGVTTAEKMVLPKHHFLISQH